MKLNVFCNKFEKKFPLSKQLDGDNSGRYYGDDNRDIKTVFVCLDINRETIRMAITNSCDLILSHHPFELKPWTEIILNNEIKRSQFNRLKNVNIAIYSGHTSVDAAKNGMNEWLGAKLSLIKVKKLNKEGIGVYGDMIASKGMKDAIHLIQNIFGEEIIRTGFIDVDRKVKRLAVIGGSGGSYIEDAIRNDCDLIVTSDVKWNQWQLAHDQKITIIDVGHYMEQIFVPKVADIVKKFGLDVIEYNPMNLVSFRKTKLTSNKTHHGYESLNEVNKKDKLN